jgi:hypothetical protein
MQAGDPGGTRIILAGFPLTALAAVTRARRCHRDGEPHAA